ncbi:GNAT family N-acetyltransferase [Chamaesiphon minutus]|uniref:Sortase-like acyltransferase n=1 Tax=Chamaesiphon minutus (strain ATCC 27169 / PCC 6605) TaxID=1173020 RepID=K9UN10_CHAP6|nr:GNAT family N-acetyltransferase [Chamaesiphon minutus]AFY96492.1 sortase-like acyltransferase [Chamaesiphon minutus PCC 6605]
MIREATIADLPAIIEIYNTSIPGRMATADLEPVTVASRMEWFLAHNPELRPLWVSTAEDKIEAWLSFRSFYGRAAYRHTAEISIYVSPDSLRQKLGDRLLSKAIETAPQLDLKTLVAFIFAHNQPSLNLFKKHDFQQWGYLPQIAELNGIDRDLVILGRQLSINP